MANYAQTLSDIYRGGLLSELDEKLSEVVKAAELTGKQGSLALTLKIKTKGNSGQVESIPVVIAALPEHYRDHVLMFVPSECNLQLQLPPPCIFVL